MRNESPQMLVHINLDRDFIESVKEEMEDEFRIACKKWEISLTENDMNLIFDHSLKQLRRKVSENIGTNWDLSDKLTVKVAYTENIEITLPGKLPHKKYSLLKTRDGWSVDYESCDGAVQLSDFKKYMKNKINTWARTAVFYGVGSFVV